MQLKLHLLLESTIKQPQMRTDYNTFHIRAYDGNLLVATLRLRGTCSSFLDYVSRPTPSPGRQRCSLSLKQLMPTPMPLLVAHVTENVGTVTAFSFSFF